MQVWIGPHNTVVANVACEFELVVISVEVELSAGTSASRHKFSRFKVCPAYYKGAYSVSQDVHHHYGPCS